MFQHGLPYFRDPAKAQGDLRLSYGLLAFTLITAGCTSTSTGPSTGPSCSALGGSGDSPPPEVLQHADELVPVDCLLPGRWIGIGQYAQFLGPPRPARLALWECKVRGGSYVAGDRADRETSLNVWLACAKQGDKVAQNIVGEIYQKGWGVGPDYAKAAEWYRKAADQGYARARHNLAVLYDRGLGVPRDEGKAAVLSATSTEVGGGAHRDAAASQREIDQLRTRLANSEQEIAKLRAESEKAAASLTRKQEEFDRLLRSAGDRAAGENAQIMSLRGELEQSNQREKKLRQQLDEANQRHQDLRARLTRGIEVTPGSRSLSWTPGRYYALVIGINQYRAPLNPLQTAVNDAKRVASVLSGKYGFTTIVLTDDTGDKPNRGGIFAALDRLSRQLTKTDNLLIYYAGHGVAARDRYYWLPLGADSADSENRISTNDITSFIDPDKNPARHVLVIADSCYAGAMGKTRSIAVEPASGARDKAFIMAKARKMSRRFLSSGGLEPVLDADGGEGLSVFAKAFTQFLASNDDIVSAEELYHHIGPEVTTRALQMNFHQTPVYEMIAGLGSEVGGDFVFMPRQTAATTVSPLYRYADAAAVTVLLTRPDIFWKTKAW